MQRKNTCRPVDMEYLQLSKSQIYTILQYYSSTYQLGSCWSLVFKISQSENFNQLQWDTLKCLPENILLERFRRPARGRPTKCTSFLNHLWEIRFYTQLFILTTKLIWVVCFCYSCYVQSQKMYTENWQIIINKL